MAQLNDDMVVREQALSEALKYVTILTPKDKIAVGPQLVVEIAETFYQFLCGAPKNV
jgi:hypothetical protein